MRTNVSKWVKKIQGSAVSVNLEEKKTKLNYQFRQSHVPDDDVLASADGDEPVGDTVQSDEHRVAVGVANYVEIARRRVAQILLGQTHSKLGGGGKKGKNERTGDGEQNPSKRFRFHRKTFGSFAVRAEKRDVQQRRRKSGH